MRTRRAGAERDTGPHGHAQAPLLVLTLAGFAVVGIIGFVLVLYLHDAGLDHERREAEEAAQLSGNAIVAPLITPALIDGDKAALGRLTRPSTGISCTAAWCGSSCGRRTAASPTPTSRG